MKLYASNSSSSTSQWPHNRCCPQFWKMPLNSGKVTTPLQTIWILDHNLFSLGRQYMLHALFAKKKLPKSAKYDHGSCSKKRLPRTGGHHPFFQSQHHSNRETGTSMYLQMAHPFAPHRFEVPVEHLATCLTHCRASGGLQSKIWRQF